MAKANKNTSVHGMLVVLLVLINIDILVASQIKQERGPQLFFISLPLLCFCIYQYQKRKKSVVAKPAASFMGKFLPARKYGLAKKINKKNRQPERVVPQTLLKEGEKVATVLN